MDKRPQMPRRQHLERIYSVFSLTCEVQPSLGSQRGLEQMGYLWEKVEVVIVQREPEIQEFLGSAGA